MASSFKDLFIDPKFLAECRAMAKAPSSSRWTTSSCPSANSDITDTSLLQRMTAQMAPYSYQQARFYYFGLPSRPTFVASSHTEAWVPPTGPEAYLVAKELRPVGDHKVVDIWEAGLADRVIAYLTKTKVDWTSLDVVRIAIVGNAFAPVVLWIGVSPKSLSGQDGRNAALDVRNILYESEIDDIHVEIRESRIIKAATLLTPVDLADSVAAVASPLTTTLGVSICADEGQGTGGFYVSKSGTPDKIFLVTARHIISRPSLMNNETIKYTNSSQPRHEVSILGDAEYEDFLASIKKEIGWNVKITEDEELRRRAAEMKEGDHAEDKRAKAEGLIKAAEKATIQLNTFYGEVVSKWGNSAERMLGHVVLAPPIEGNVGPHGFTQDIAVIEVDKSKVDTSNFLGNVIDLGTKIDTTTFKDTMNPPCSPTNFTYPANGLLKLSGIIPINEMRHHMMVLKNGIGSSTTIGRANSVFSYTRYHFENSPGIISKEWIILPADSKSDSFSTPGDSGSVVVDGSGRFGGLLIGGSGATAESLDITYATPISFVLGCLEDFGFKVDFDLLSVT